MDYSQDISTLLRISTVQAHDTASKSQGAGWLTRGELDRDEYVRYLMMLYHIYDAFERALEQHATHPVLLPSYNPGLLSRASSLAADISQILQVPESQWQTHPLHVQLMSPPPAELTAYITRINEVASTEPARLLSHSYARYLGDLSGGQFIKRVLAKSYELQDGLGLSFYEFRQLGSGSTLATIGDMKKIKDWFRDGMNAGVADDVALKQAVIEEANIAYHHNIALLALLRPPSRPAPAPVGDSGTPPEPSPVAEKQQLDLQPSVSTYRTSTVVALIAAVCLAHFFIVVGGFTGEKGAAKLEALQQWFASSSST
ncbi:hypothetical protein BXZ70DRAFT_540606 [Cristinia sonorae]|uniref:Heme oxygenase n=1 Tax=Cristinia sonorae TaxID=1940300 RepID=A0A8K0UI56_9AGAR|nr:hypothetical protein BXZ70DRAFT_540606 [Cristinia sonorae]